MIALIAMALPRRSARDVPGWLALEDWQRIDHSAEAKAMMIWRSQATRKRLMHKVRKAAGQEVYEQHTISIYRKRDTFPAKCRPWHHPRAGDVVSEDE